MLEKKKDNNTLIFFLLSFLIIVGAMQFNAWLNPVKKRVDPDPPKETAKSPPTKVPPPLSARIASAIGLLSQSQGTASLVGAAALAADTAELAKQVPKKPIFEAPRHIVKLGGDANFNLSVLLDSKGAAVIKVVLNKFQEADFRGRREWEDRATKEEKRLEFVQLEMNRDVGSNLLFHYAANDNDPRPV